MPSWLVGFWFDANVSKGIILISNDMPFKKIWNIVQYFPWSFCIMIIFHDHFAESFKTKICKMAISALMPFNNLLPWNRRIYLYDRWQDVVEANRALEETGKILVCTDRVHCDGRTTGGDRHAALHARWDRSLTCCSCQRCALHIHLMVPVNIQESLINVDII